MSQTNWIAAFLVIGFIAYVVGNNQLQQYVAIVWGSSSTSNASSSPSLSLNSMGQSVASSPITQSAITSSLPSLLSGLIP